MSRLFCAGDRVWTYFVISFTQLFTLLIIVCVILPGETPHILESIRRLKYRLSDLIDPDFGLLEQLLNEQVLTPRECAKIRSQNTLFERNEVLLDYLTSEDECRKLLKALEQTCQRHIANFVIENGG